ncbi:uncharacterized protein CTRU02_203789 [Colletotrichum truncatum]|uniref:Uncharacterized protein n=1 Tax=Colletotrichum truncatum TaxID=5467 RepID=A0ACC3ZA90_COLTU|nr:uncharacterized protein CTRU02_04121 [Colletotrichum truncatum]KAF6796160.1 hypothetical protein CTRU02_04121 [Colletotrichum truncatum]
MSANPIVPYEIAETIRRKKAKYCRYADTNQWHLFDQIALPDATFKFVDKKNEVVRQNGAAHEWGSLAEFQEHFTKTNAHIDAIHMVNAGELEMVADDEVKAIFGVLFHAGALDSEAGLHSTGAGHYHEVWKKVGDDWFLKSLWMQLIYWKVQVI